MRYWFTFLLLFAALLLAACGASDVPNTVISDGVVEEDDHGSGGVDIGPLVGHWMRSGEDFDVHIFFYADATWRLVAPRPGGVVGAQDLAAARQFGEFELIETNLLLYTSPDAEICPDWVSSYSFKIIGAGGQLNLTPIDDRCAMLSIILPGEYTPVFE